jgi:hypothetical protein
MGMLLAMDAVNKATRFWRTLWLTPEWHTYNYLKNNNCSVAVFDSNRHAHGVRHPKWRASTSSATPAHQKYHGYAISPSGFRLPSFREEDVATRLAAAGRGRRTLIAAALSVCLRCTA